MELKKFERARKVYNKIAVIDEEIEMFNKLGEVMNAYAPNSNMMPLFSISVPDPRTIIQPTPPPVPDEDGFVVIDGKDMPYEIAVSLGLIKTNEQPKMAAFTYQKAITDVLSFKLLSLLLAERLQEKAVLVKRMEGYGVTPSRKKKVSNNSLKPK